MRHRKDVNNFGRTASHRRAMLRNMVIDLFYWTPDQIADSAKREAKRVGLPSGQRDEFITKRVGRQQPHRIRTMPEKAKAARRIAEKLITLGKKGTLAARRQAISKLGGTSKARNAVKKLFAEIAPSYARRQGGYTRIIRLPESIRYPHRDLPATYLHPYGTRYGDGAPQVLLELVEPEPQKKERRRKRTRRAKVGAGKARKGEAKPREDAGAAGKEEPAAGKKETAAEKKEPAAGKKEPAAGKKEPAAEKKEPAAEKKEPAAGKKEPATGAPALE